MITPAPAFQAAFGPTPDRVPPAPSDAEGRWLVAVALGGLGRYAAATAVLEQLITDAVTPTRIAAHAAVTRAAHLRQLGGHAAARRFDALALRLATAACSHRPDRSTVTRSGGFAELSVTEREGATETWAAVHPECPAGLDAGLDAEAARIDALVGLAADAVGLGDLQAAERLLDRARPAAAAHPSWRPGVRVAWVRAELHLVQGRAAAATRCAAAALTAARAGGSLRHVLKSRLVLAVARGAGASTSTSVSTSVSVSAIVTELDELAARCGRQGLLPLRWPAALAAADLGNRYNERSGPAVKASPVGGPSGTTRRRHAAGATLSVLEQRSDPLGKRQMGESVWIPPPLTLL